MASRPKTYHRHRFPAEIISYAVWLYHVFSLSLRAVELILAERGVPSRMRASAGGAASSVRNSPTGSADAGHGLVTFGTWMKCLFGSTVICIISGERSTSMVSCSTSWSRIAGMLQLPSAS